MLAVREWIALLYLFIASPTAYADLLFSAAGPGPVANLYTVDEAGELQKITDDIRWRDMDADISQDGRVVFSSNREQKLTSGIQKGKARFHLFLTDLKGTDPIPLSSGESDERMPRFSPDARKIAFIRRVRESQQLVLTEPGATETVLFSSEEIFDFSWSPDGGQLALALRNGAKSELRLISATEGKKQAGDPLVNGEGRDWIAAARWAPDGRHIAFIRHPLRAGERRLMVLDLKSGQERRLSPEGVQVQQPPDWSGDSKLLTYAALVNYRYRYDEKLHKKIYEGAMHLFMSSLDGETRQLSKGSGMHSAPVFSPNEEKIAFLYAPSLDARRFALRTISLDGESLQDVYPSVTRNSGIIWY